jgi:hypothetical protein
MKGPKTVAPSLANPVKLVIAHISNTKVTVTSDDQY